MKREWRKLLTPTERIALADYDRRLAEIDNDVAHLRSRVHRLVGGGSSSLKAIRETWAPVIEGKLKIQLLLIERTTVAAHRHKLVNRASAKAAKAVAA